MEMNILKVVNFDLGIPLSYRFLRRYARVSDSLFYLSRFSLNKVLYGIFITNRIHLK